MALLKRPTEVLPTSSPLSENLLRKYRQQAELIRARIEQDYLHLQAHLPPDNYHLNKFRNLYEIFLQSMENTSVDPMVISYPAKVSLNISRKIKPYADSFASTVRAGSNAFDARLQDFMTKCQACLTEDLDAYMGSIPMYELGRDQERQQSNTECMRLIQQNSERARRKHEFQKFWDKLLEAHDKVKRLMLNYTGSSMNTRLEKYLQHVLVRVDGRRVSEQRLPTPSRYNTPPRFENGVTSMSSDDEFFTPPTKPRKDSIDSEYESAQENTPVKEAPGRRVMNETFTVRPIPTVMIEGKLLDESVSGGGMMNLTFTVHPVEGELLNALWTDSPPRMRIDRRNTSLRNSPDQDEIGAVLVDASLESIQLQREHIHGQRRRSEESVVNPVLELKQRIVLVVSKIEHDLWQLASYLPALNVHVVEFSNLYQLLVDDLEHTPFDSLIESRMVTQDMADKLRPYANHFLSSLRVCVNNFDERLNEFVENCLECLTEQTRDYARSFPASLTEEDPWFRKDNAECERLLEGVSDKANSQEDFPEFWERLLKAHEKIKLLKFKNTMYSFPTYLEKYLQHVLVPIDFDMMYDSPE